ncbi:MAG TPA: AAA family ATPase, partial [Candidatus Binataceae bacterium]
MSESSSKLARIRDELNRIFLERSEHIDGALAAMLSANHVLMIGPPGTAKSMLAEELCTRIEGANYFQWLLTRFSTPEEIFGAVSLKSLEQDDYRRVTTYKLPQAHIAFLDEIFKANSSILNALLSIINERIFHN